MSLHSEMTYAKYQLGIHFTYTCPFAIKYIYIIGRRALKLHILNYSSNKIYDMSIFSYIRNKSLCYVLCH